MEVIINIKNKAVLFLFCVLFFSSCRGSIQTTKNYADTVLMDGSILTVDKKFHIYEALAIKDNRIFKVGSNNEIEHLIGPSTFIFNLNGKSVLPGFIDSHIHFLMTLQTSKYINIRPDNAKTLGDILLKIKEKVVQTKPGEWIIGFGWDQDKIVWPGERKYKWPTKKDLDSVALNNPVLLFRIGGHSAVANSLALKLAKIDNSTINPAGGEIVKFKNGEITGILKENAINLVSKLIPEINFTSNELEKFCYLALSKGLTNIEEANLTNNALDFYKKAFDKGKVPIRVNTLLNAKELDYLIENKITSPYDVIPQRLRICGVKFFADGGLGERTAALKEPYSDDIDNSGILIKPEEWFIDMFIKAHNNGIQTATHAIGDLASEVILKANYISYAKLNIKQGLFRDGIEHCQVLSQNLIDKFVQQNMIASIQFSFWSSDKSWVEKRLGRNRMKYAYAWNKLLSRKVLVSGGTDSPVETYVPLIGLENIVKESHIPIKEAIKLYTYNAAYASFQEQYLGTLEKGKLADLVVLSDNILKTHSSKISKLKVILTIIDGKILYKE
jgi:predicted amidohydrolase YtcJ